jgi:hypothetical protein
MSEQENEPQDTPKDIEPPVISMAEYAKAKDNAEEDEFKKNHIKASTDAIQGNQPTVTVTLSEKGLEVYGNIYGAPLHSILAMAAHTMLGQVPKSDYEVRT